jgi:cyanophycinase-like exopeptidase
VAAARWVAIATSRDLSLRKPATLIAGKFRSRNFGTRPYLADALRLTGKDRPLVLYIGAASGDDREFGAALVEVLEAAGAHRVLWPKLTGRNKEPARACDALEEVDLVFVGGGDVEAGVDTLDDADLSAPLRAAARRGVTLAGMSAGAIMLGERWVRWPNADAGDDEAETYPCLGLVPCSFDTHGEGDGWSDARSFAGVRARELQKKVDVLGVPSGAALVVDADGAMRARGAPVVVYSAQPNEQAALAGTLEATE